MNRHYDDLDIDSVEAKAEAEAKAWVLQTILEVPT